MNNNYEFFSDFTSPDFKKAFMEYAGEIHWTVDDWDGLFESMGHDKGENFAYVYIAESGQIAGFLQFTVMDMESWFFKTKLGFVREFWISEGHRNNRHGTALLRLTEEYFKDHGVGYAILTTDTAERFYLKNGYEKSPKITALNGDMVYLKRL
ncbi:MAG: GNAT family N-acetyltransferase [Oscillospiraceae bacterium]|nr:GNAT family N-acetyltransferase [Oscillospiraceae bacterium]